MKASYSGRGFTLVELMVTIAISAIIISTVTSSWANLVERSAAAQVKSGFRNAFSEAREQAVHQRKIVTLCPLDGSMVCTSDWDRPVSLFLDPGNAKKLTHADNLIRIVQLTDTGSVVSSSVGYGNRRYFQYNPDGSARGSIGNLTWCPPSADRATAVQVRLNFGGRLRFARDTDGDGIVEDSGGDPVSC